MKRLVDEILICAKEVDGLKNVPSWSLGTVGVQQEGDLRGAEYIASDRAFGAIKLAFERRHIDEETVDVEYFRDVEYNAAWRRYVCKDGKPVVAIDQSRGFRIYGEAWED